MRMKSIGNIYTSVSSKFGLSSLGKKVTKGGFWLSFGGLFEQLMRFGRNMLLSRILLPEAFGTMALVLSITQMFESLSEIGVKEAIIQNPNGDEARYLNGAWFFSLFRGLLLTGTGFIAAPIIARFYSSGEVVGLLRIALIGLTVRGAMSARAYVGLKHLNFKRWMFVENLGGGLGICVAVILSVIYKNTIGLVIGFLAETVFRVILSYILFPFTPKWIFDKAYVSELLKYARRYFGMPIFTYLFLHADIFVIARIIGATELGSYALAASVARMPDLIMSKIATPLMVPAYSILQSNQSKISNSLKRIFSIMFLIGLPIGVMCLINGPDIIKVLFTEKNRIAGRAFGYLVLASVIRNMGVPFVSICLATNRAQIARRVVAGRTAVFIAVVIPATITWGITGTAVSMLFTVVLMYFVQILILQKFKFFSIKNIIRPIVSSLLLSLLPISIWAGSYLLPNVSQIFFIIITGVSLLFIYVFLAAKRILN